MPSPSSVLRPFRGFQVNVLRRPTGPRQVVNRILLVAAIGLAGFSPFLISTATDSIEDVAGVEFRSLLADLEAARTDLNLLEDDPTASQAQISALKQRTADLDQQTFIGYIKRDGDAPRAGALAPDFRLLNLDGNPVQLSALGQPAVVNFWASWCSFCIEEMPDFQLLQQIAGDRVTVIGINREESLSTAVRFASQTGANYTLLLDLDDELGGRGGPYQVIGMPTTLYVNADGTVNEVVVGFHTLERMTEAVNDLLGADALETETTPQDTSFAALTTEILQSQQANHAVAAELFARFNTDPTLAGDIAWQRNVEAQTRAWLVNLEALQALTPPAQLQTLHQDVLDAFLVLETAAGQLQAALTDTETAGIVRGIALIDSALPGFDTAVDNLRGVLATP